MDDDAPKVQLSPKQVVSLKESKGCRVSIWSGSVRSGKTISACFAFFEAIPLAPKSGIIIIAGRTLQTIERNVIEPMQDPDVFADFAKHVTHTRGSSVATICGRTVHLIGANDARSEGKLRGVTAALAMIDEATLVPEAFFTQMLARLSKEGSRLLCTTNPDSPAHWLKKNYLDRIDELNMRHWHFLMRDNPTLPDSYIRDIEAEYTGLWYRRFILGEWVSAEGAIYDMWDTTKHVVSRDALPPMQRVLGLGMDYGSTNPTAGVLLGLGNDNRLYVIGEWAPRKGSTDSELADQLQAWLDTQPEPEWLFLDPSAKSFHLELYQRGHHNLAKAKNDVLDGIRTVASLLASDRLRVVDTCANLIGEIPGYRWDDKASEKGEDKPVKTADHFCFVAGTMVDTDHGQRPIETIRPGDNVWTRDGLRPVSIASATRLVPTIVIETSDGRTLQGTANHPVMTSGGWTPLGELRPGSEVLTWPPSMSPSSTASSTAATPTPICPPHASTTRQASATGCAATRTSTATSGRTITARSRRGIISTTSTTTRSTTTSRTLSASRPLSTSSITRASREAKRNSKRLSATCRTSSRRPASGIGRKRGTLTTSRTVSASGSWQSTAMKSASSVVAPIALVRSSARRGSAPTPASRRGGATPASTTWTAIAQPAATPSVSTSTARSRLVPVRVVASYVAESATVYNLQVDGKPEYFANGVLVHNCDALRYIAHSSQRFWQPALQEATR